MSTNRIMEKRVLAVLTMLCIHWVCVDGFLGRARVPFGSSYLDTFLYANGEDDGIETMSARELKKALQELRVSTVGVLEKGELVDLLRQARRNRSERSPSTPEPVSTQSHGKFDSWIVPLYFTSLNQGSRVAAVNIPGGITIPSGTVYPSVTLSIGGETVSLLLDTACTGFIVRPSVVQRCGLPTVRAPVTITAAGGDTGQRMAEVAQLNRFTMGDRLFSGKTYPVAVQDMDVLADSADGIIGLSFLAGFAAVDLDFVNGKLIMHNDIPTVDSSLTTLAAGTMKLLTSVGGLYYTPVLLGGRGPVNMLIDTGASSTILSWKGLADLGMDRSSSLVQRLPTATGSMGFDNVFSELTHRVHVSSSLKLAGDYQNPGISLAGSGRLPIDVGSVPLLDALAEQGVGGILGIDGIMRSSVCRLVFRGEPKILFFK